MDVSKRWSFGATALVMVVSMMSQFSSAAASVVDLDVTFEVVNRNGSLAPCEADGLTYRVAGTLVSPESELLAPSPAVTVYLSSSAHMEIWRVAVPGYDHVAEMAALGHASLALDQLGYGLSDVPDGRDVCIGSQADIAAQVAAHLRAGTYQSSGAAPAFDDVNVVGVSMSGHVVEIVASSFPSAFDTHVIAGWAPPTVRPEIAYAAATAARLATRCGLSPEPKRPGQNDGYATYFDEGELLLPAFMHRNPDQDALAALDARRERDACGIVASQGAAVFGSFEAVEHATRPILVFLGDHDLFGAPELYAARFANSVDARWCLIPDAGHLWMVEEQAPVARDLLSTWLDDPEALSDRAACGSST